VVSVRTGRLVFTAAGISEKVHFAQPFKLIWAEMLADGNLGELFFDYNNYGQRFDGFNYNPCNIMLSKFVTGATDGYLRPAGRSASTTSPPISSISTTPATTQRQAPHTLIAWLPARRPARRAAPTPTCT